LTGLLIRASGEVTGIYSIGQGSLMTDSNYKLVYIGGLFTITPTPTIIPVNTTNNTNFIAETDPVDLVAVLGEQTTNEDTKNKTNNSDIGIKGDSDKKNDNNKKSTPFFEQKLFGIAMWLWLLLLTTLAGAGWWYVSRNRQSR